MRTTVVFALLVSVLRADGEKKPISAFRLKTHPKQVKHAIDLKEVKQGVRSSGKDPRDVIRTILKPEHVSAKDAVRAGYVRDTTRVLGMTVKGESRAYPLYILQVHELANDTLGGVPIAPNY